MRHPEFPAVSFLSIFLLLCSLPSHIRAGSVAIISLIAWLAVMSLIRGINTIIWANNYVVRLEVWCDITTKITIGFTYAIPASALCILRHLENLSSGRNAITVKSDKQRRQRFEALMCFGIPILGMALHYIVQGHRFDLFEDIGCAPTVYFSIAAIFIIWIPPMIMSLMSFGYAGMAVRHFLRHRIEFATYLRNSQASISPTRYFRLMAMAIVEMVWDTGVNAYVIYFNTFAGLRPWISWENVHSNFSRVQIFPESMIPSEFKTQLIWQWWIVPVSCICFFIFFGLGEEAVSDYRAAVNWFRRTILFQNIGKARDFDSANALPTHRMQSQYPKQIYSFTRSTSISTRDMNSDDELSFKISDVMESGYCGTARTLVTSNATESFVSKQLADFSRTTLSPVISMDQSDQSISPSASPHPPHTDTERSALPQTTHELPRAAMIMQSDTDMQAEYDSQSMRTSQYSVPGGLSRTVSLDSSQHGTDDDTDTSSIHEENSSTRSMPLRSEARPHSDISARTETKDT